MTLEQEANEFLKEIAKQMAILKCLEIQTQITAKKKDIEFAQNSLQRLEENPINYFGFDRDDITYVLSRHGFELNGKELRRK